jgi:hypothetical protein
MWSARSEPAPAEVSRGAGTGSAEPGPDAGVGLETEVNPAGPAVDGIADDTTPGDTATGTVSLAAEGSTGSVEPDSTP